MAAPSLSKLSGDGSLRLLSRDVDRETVELVGQRDLAREATARTPLGDAKVEQVVLKVTRPANKTTKLFTHPHVTGGTRVVAATLADDPRHAVAHGGGHDRFANLADDDALVAHGADVDHLRHCDLLGSVMA